MDVHQHINSMFHARDQHALSRLFDISDRAMLNCIQAVDLSLIAAPFDALLGTYRSFAGSPTFENSLSVLRGCGIVLDSTRAVKQIIKNSIWCMTLGTGDGNTPAELSAAFKNALLALFRAAADKNAGLSIYISNILCMAHLEDEDYRSVTDLVALSRPTCRNNDYHVFMFYKGLISLYNERLQEGYACVSAAFRSRKLRKHIFPVVFAVSSLTLGTGQAQSRWCIESRAVPRGYAGGAAARYSPLLLSLDVFSEYLDGTQDSNNPCFAPDDLRLLIKSREIVANGFIDILDGNMPTRLYTETHLVRLMKVFQPLFCFRNLVYRFYLASRCPTRLSISDVLRFTSKERAEVHCIVLCCIYRGLIRGYLSADRDIIVLSRVAPFPDVLKPASGPDTGPLL